MTEPVVVTGLGAVTSIGHDAGSFGRALRAGTLGFVTTEDELAPDGLAVSAPVTDFDLERSILGVERLCARTRDSVLQVGIKAQEQVQSTIAVCAQAWADAGLDDQPLPADRIGVVVGGNNISQGYVSDNREVFEDEPLYLSARYALHAQDTDVVATVSEAFGIHGEGYTVGASSASGNAAIVVAARMIACGALDACLAIGAMTRLEPAMRAALFKLGVLATPVGDDDGLARPFDKARDGFVPGEAAACLLLESRRSARLRDVLVAAELGGYAQTLDGNSLPDPDVRGESRAMAKALAHAGITGDRVDYVNAHATATPAGDDTEIEAIIKVLDGGNPWVNATKGLIGHCLSAAGAIEAVASTLQLRDGFVHPNPALDSPTTGALRLVGHEAVETELTCALSNSFGFGGFNSSLVLLHA